MRLNKNIVWLVLLVAVVAEGQKNERLVDSRFVQSYVEKDSKDTVYYLSSNFLKDGEWVFYYDEAKTKPAIAVSIKKRRISTYYREWYSNGEQRYAATYHSDGWPASYEYRDREGAVVNSYIFKTDEFAFDKLTLNNSKHNKRSRFEESYELKPNDDILVDVNAEDFKCSIPAKKTHLFGIGRNSIIVAQSYPNRMVVVPDSSVNSMWIHKTKGCKGVKIHDYVLGPGLLIATPFLFTPGSFVYRAVGAIGVGSVSYSMYKFLDCQRLYRPLKMKKGWEIIERAEPLSVSNTLPD